MHLDESGIMLLVNIAFYLAVCSLALTLVPISKYLLITRREKGNESSFAKFTRLNLLNDMLLIHKERLYKLYNNTAESETENAEKIGSDLFEMLLKAKWEKWDQKGENIEIRFSDGRILYVHKTSPRYQLIEALFPKVDELSEPVYKKT